MNNQPSIRSTWLLAGVPLLLALTGCGGNVHIVHSDVHGFHPIPFVSASSENPPDRFELAAIVSNATNSNYPANTFALRVEANYSTTQQHNCQKSRDVDVYVPLAPDQVFELDHVRFDTPNHPPSPCHCYKDQCSGVVWLTLIRQDNEQRVEGEKTKFITTWSSSDDPSDISTWEIVN